MALLVRGPAHRHEFELQAGLFQPEKLLSYECLGQARIALEEHHDFFCIGHVARVSFEVVFVGEPVTRLA